MHVASIKSCNRIASSLHGAMMSARPRDFGMLDPLSCALALTGDKEHQRCCQFSSLVTFSSQENPEPNSSHRSNVGRSCVGVHFSVAVLFRLAAEQSNSEPNKRIKPARIACSTVQELRTCTAAYARRSASRR